ncbi:hypothetical protein HPB49_012565 [Dermacentor silvarum]|uniref:Uncharacterized protein n=1 Tax=Dermacentor silvarum TaxID=543639 RepID=A0ACB8CF74_DERSI|nr:hypothetical protein HPB49_012565 [Dermacentor silvarum]
MEIQFEGKDVDPEDLTEDAGWRTAKSRRAPTNKTVNTKYESGSALPSGSLTSDPCGTPKGAKQRILRAGKMPHLPTGDTKVVIRPRSEDRPSRQPSSKPRESPRKIVRRTPVARIYNKTLS